MSRRLYLLAATLCCMAFVMPAKKITIWMIGDSTMSIKKTSAYPETGWGMAFGGFFNNNVTIENKAQNGRSTLSFINEKRWDSVMAGLNQGDYVFIEFGHNDEKLDKPGVGTTIEQYKQNLCLFVNDARSKKAVPVLLTPIMRRSFKDGVLKDTHGAYPDAVRKVADSLQVPLIDMHVKTRTLLEGLGEDSSKVLFNHVAAGHPNYPQGKKDDTHLSPEGAKRIAALAAQGVQELKLGLAMYLKP